MATAKKDNRYIEAVGRRKQAVARVRITPASKTSITVNGREVTQYFPTEELQYVTHAALGLSGEGSKYTITAVIEGGGIHAQAEAFRHGMARALVEENDTLRKPLKAEGYLKRDPRSKERKKFGLKKARRAPQWSKR